MKAKKVCPRCESENIDQVHHYNIETMKHEFKVICYECGFATEKHANNGDAWNEWNRRKVQE